MSAFNGALLRELREGKGYTQQELAKAINEAAGYTVLDYSTIGRWERLPTAQPKPSKISRVAELLGVDPNSLYGDTESQVFSSQVDLAVLISRICSVYEQDPQDVRLKKAKVLFL